MAKIKGTAIQKKLESKKVTTLREWFDDDNFKGKLMSALPKLINREAFIINAYNIYATNTKLQRCTVPSFLNALMQAAKVGLIPNTPLGHCHIIPYGIEAKFQMGYPGYIELALRTGQYQSIYAHAVYPQDEFKASYGLEKNLIHIPSNEPIPLNEKPIYFYAVYKLVNGGYDFVYWTRDKVLQHRDKHSSGFRSAKEYNKESVWEVEEEFMGRKTMVIQVLKMAPKSTEMVRALSTEPEGEGYKNYFDDVEMDITPEPEQIEQIEPDPILEEPDIEPATEKQIALIKKNILGSKYITDGEKKQVEKDLPGMTKYDAMDLISWWIGDKDNPGERSVREEKEKLAKENKEGEGVLL